tara:strand:- start:411 stop:707 length:297 start_codon:yes stop_codon:yes gene_type:complete
MNSANGLIITFILSIVILVVLGYILFNMDGTVVQKIPAISLGASVFLLFTFIIFIIDLYMQIDSLRKKIENTQNQIHKDIMKRYIECNKIEPPSKDEE